MQPVPERYKSLKKTESRLTILSSGCQSKATGIELLVICFRVKLSTSRSLWGESEMSMVLWRSPIKGKIIQTRQFYLK